MRARTTAAKQRSTRKRPSAVRAPPRYAPEMPRAVKHVPSGDEWLHELKISGTRLGCYLERGAVKLESTRGMDQSSRHAELAIALGALPAERALIDGELAWLTPDGLTRAPGRALAIDGAQLLYFAYDLLALNSEDLTEQPLEARKERLAALLEASNGEVIRYTDHIVGAGPEVLARACELGAAGVVSKRRNAPHRAGRSEDWVETRCAVRPKANRARGRPAEAAQSVQRGRAARPQPKLTNPQRILYPRLGTTKLQLAAFYASIADWMLPHLLDRPLTIVRCASGASREDSLRTECQFLRHGPEWHRWVPAFVRRIQIPEQKKVGEYLVVDSPEALVAIVNGDILEFHTWNSRASDLEQPDRLVFDLDPGPGVSWPAIKNSAVALRDVLADAGLQSWLKTTGGKGLHVVVPLAPVAWDRAYAWAQRLAHAAAIAHPRLFTLDFARAARRGKILIDYKRNHRTAVSVAAFSTRARPHAPLSVPIAWEELPELPASDSFTVENVRRRLGSLRRDPWCEYWSSRQALPTTRSRRSD